MGLTHRGDRKLYPGGRPSAAARAINRWWARLAAAGLSPSRLVAIEVPGRRTGRMTRAAVVVADHQGERYLVSMLGEGSDWVRNVRAANGLAVLRHGRSQRVRLEEVPLGGRAAILRRYLECAPGARAHVPVDRRAPASEFERVAGRFPVFRITPGDRVPEHRSPAS